MWHPWSPLVIQPSGLNSVLRLLCVVNHVLLMNWFAATSCKSCQSCFRCFQSLLFSRIFWLCGETDRGSSGRGTQNHQIWITLDHLSGCHTLPSQSRAICRTWSCKLDASSDSQARRGNRGGNSGVSVEMWVCGLLFSMITLEFF